MAKKKRLNIEAIRSSLVKTQKNFDTINASLTVRRKPPSNEVIENMIAGYALIDDYAANNIALFAPGNSHLLLDLNHTVLYHSANISFEEDKSQFKATKDHFYKTSEGGIGSLMEWLDIHKNRTIWKRSAGVFSHLLSQPQLFLEGNHRTGSLIMSYMLLATDKSPFVLTPENANYFFEPAELIKKRRKKTFDEILYLPKQTRKFAKLLKDEQTKKFLL